MMTWNKNMDDAPRDGTRFLALCKDGLVVFGRYEPDIFVVVNNGGYSDGGYGRDYRTKKNYPYSDYEEFTHWMPLPQPPEVEG
jgi:hypothetical protein